MPNTQQLLQHINPEDLFTLVYTITDDHLKQSIQMRRFNLPTNPNQKATYAELMTIALVGEILHQPHSGTWFQLVKTTFQHLFPNLPDITRYHRILRNLERIWADLALILANESNNDSTYVIDSQPIPVCRLKRGRFKRAMTEAAVGFSSKGGIYGFKLHAVINNAQMLCRFAIVPANEADVTVARCLLNAEQDDLSLIVGDKAYLGLGVFTPPKRNAKRSLGWTRLMGQARQLVETTFSSLARGQHVGLCQLNSFWSVRASVCRKVAAHNLALWLGL